MKISNLVNIALGDHPVSKTNRTIKPDTTFRNISDIDLTITTSNSYEIIK